MFSLIIIVGVAFFLQGILGFLQMRHLTNAFMELRRRGRVAFGRRSGGFYAGAVVMFRIDEDGIIREGRKLEGLTAFARVKPLDGFEGRHIGSLVEEDGPAGHKNLGKAIADAALTYRKYMAGEVIEDPPTPFEKAGAAITGLLNIKTRTI